MKGQVSGALIRIYERAARGGLLRRPLLRRAYESSYLAYKRLIEAGPIDGLRGLVSDGSTVIDVGANIGFFSLRFARWVGSSGRVIAIEPEALNIDSLRRRLARAGLSDIVTCVQAAAADQPGDLRLSLNPGHPADHHLADDGEPVVGVTLDEVAANDGRPVSLVKIDVQGAELMVLAGARRLIETHRPPLFVEVHEPSLARFGSSGGELIDAVIALGYGGHRLTRQGVGACEGRDQLIAHAAAGYIDVLFLPLVSAAPAPERDVGEHR